MADVHRILRRLRRRRRERRVKTFLNRPNPMNKLSDDEIFIRYRFKPESVMFLLSLLSPYLCSRTRRSMAIPPLLQLLVTLRFLATGSFYRLIGDSLGLSVASVSRCVDRVCNALCRLSDRYIRFPVGEVASAMRRAFFDIAGFPQVVGCIDGTFIPIQAPHENEQDYVNRKGFHSLNVQMTCDAHYKITSCVAKWPGSVHDARMFRDSHLCFKYEAGQYGGLLLGDSAYPCRPFLMTPYSNADTTSKQRFNVALCRTRVLIEQTYGILKRRFACLHTGLRLSPQKAAAVVLACVILHNFGIERGDIINVDENVDNLNFNYTSGSVWVGNRNDGEGIREHIRRNHFP